METDILLVLLRTALTASFLFFLAKRLARFLHIYQQDEYDFGRFTGWIFHTRAFDKRFSVLLILLQLVSFRIDVAPAFFQILLIAVALGLALAEEDPRKQGKKKLVMTARATRIAAIAFMFAALAALASVLAGSWLMMFLTVQLLPLTLGIANLLLKPFESSVQRRIMGEARRKLASVRPKIVGITGSFGKTSVKHILGHVLDVNARALFTPGSINTLMGISRVIREQLQPDCRFFLVEMGAYGKGSIRRLCGLTPPDCGMMTSIGAAHYERFKSLDRVVEAKFELAEAVMEKGAGKIVLHDSILEHDAARERVAARPERFVLCGTSEKAAFRILGVSQTVDGLTVRGTWEGTDYELFAPLYGEQQAGNMSLAFVQAVLLGIDPERAVAALRSTPQIAHRLEVKKQADGTIWIDDAYNANPVGFLAALGILDLFGKQTKGRRILVTPGMAELGEKHNEEHRRLGLEAVKYADLVFAVAPDRIQAFTQAFQAETAGAFQAEAAGAFQAEAGTERLHLVPTLDQALAWIKVNAVSGDVILLENDLPDLYERRLKL